MDVLLITPDTGSRFINYPWGALAIGSYLTNVRGLDVKILDASEHPKTDFFTILNDLISNAKLVGVSMMTTDVTSMKEVVDRIKETYPDKPIIVGGPHAILQPEQTCAYKNIDFVAFSEGEETIWRLFEEVVSGRMGYDNVPGLVYKKNGNVIRTHSPEPVAFYDINYKLLSASTQDNFSRSIQILSGRGCSYRCTFCFNAVCGQKWRPRPMEEFLNEIKHIVHKHDPRHIYFRDDNFFLSSKRVEEFIAAYKENKFSFKWTSSCHANCYRSGYLDRAFLKKLASVNCEWLKFGLESGSQTILDSLKKGIKVENVRSLISEFRNVPQVYPNYSFIIGVPGETIESYRKTLDLAKYAIEQTPRARIIGPQFFRVYPGGELYESIKEKYRYYEPSSFEEWAIKYRPEEGGMVFSKNFNYPWIDRRYLFLTQNAYLLTAIYSKSFQKMNFLKRIVLSPLFFLIKLRFKYGWYEHLYDLRLVVFLRKLFNRLKRI